MRDGGPEPAYTPDAPFPAELLVWFSPSFPVGGFAYSQGLEFAVADGQVRDAAALSDWLRAVTRQGALWNDLVLVSLTYRAPTATAISELAELSLALQPSRERAEEARLQGRAFLEAFQAGWSERSVGTPASAAIAGSLAVAAGQAARLRDLPLGATVRAFATGAQANAVSAAIRLGVIGQFDGQRVLFGLMPLTADICQLAQTATIDDLGGAAFAADLSCLFHETQTTRLFRS